MLIVIEGLDRTGKTSLARRLQERIGGKVLHAGPPTRGSLEEYETALDYYDPRSNEHLILDRWHIGETVWPKIFGRDTDYTEAVKRHVEMFMESRGAVMVYTTRNLSELRRDLVLFNEPLLPEDASTAQTLFDHYRKFANRTDWSWNHASDNGEQVDFICFHAACKQKVASAVWEKVGPGFVTGSFSPRVLLVGDEQGPQKASRAEPRRVPFAPFPATSGHYLLSALPDWRFTAIVNSCDRDTGEQYDLKELVNVLHGPEVVALGKNASTRLSYQGVEHRTVPHPQYWRRFRHHETTAYTDKLREVA